MTDKKKIDEVVRRHWCTDAQNSPRSNRLTVHRMTLDELRDHFVVHFPDVDFGSLELINALLYWEDEATPQEREQREEHRRAHDARHERWERETYVRLKAKFEKVSAFEGMDLP